MLTTKQHDNIDTVKGLKATLETWLEKISTPWDNCVIEEFEYQSRDGFIAYDSNRGGFDLISVESVPFIFDSYRYCVQDKIDKLMQDTINLYKEENPNTSDEDIELDIMNYADCYDDIAWRIRVFYRGFNTIEIFVGYDFDAPYFRGIEHDTFETTITFERLPDLQWQLESVVTSI